MKTRHGLLVVGLLLGTGMFLGYQKGLAESQSIAPAKIGIIDVTKVLEECQKNKDWDEKMRKEESTIRAEFDKHRAELEVLQAQIKALTPGSTDYLASMKEYVEKKASYEAKNQFYEDKFTLEMQNWMESLYQKFLKATEKVANERGLDVVLAKDQIEFPVQQGQNIKLAINMKKTLFVQPKLDISSQVLAVLDGMD